MAMAKPKKKEIDIADIPEIRSSVGLCGFMELVIHHLMYVKNVYPKAAFTRCCRKNVYIWVCEHPEVKKYVIDFLDFANKILMREKKLQICFVLCRRNKEVIEKFHFELKVKDMFVESESKLVCLLDNLVSICEDIVKTNTFTDFNTVHSGEKEITFELNIVNPTLDNLPQQAPHYPWVICKATGGKILNNVTNLKEECNKTYEVKAYSLKE